MPVPAVVDLKRVRNLKVLIALRTNIFEQLDFGARTGGQEEKFRSLTFRMTWSAAALEALLDERARAATSRFGEPVSGIADLLPPVNKTRGNALEYILSRTLLRPRDAIAYLNECFPFALNKTRLSWDHLRAAERPYSFKRYLALRDEWKASFPGIERVLNVFKHGPAKLSQEQLGASLESIALLVAEPTFPGSNWLTPLTEAYWSDRAPSEWSQRHQPLIRLLFRVGFLGCDRGKGLVVYAHDDGEFAESASNLTRCPWFEVHPAFRPALDLEEQEVREPDRA